MDTYAPMGLMVLTAMAALAQMVLEIKRERITDSVASRRAGDKVVGGRGPTSTDSRSRNALRLVEAGEPATRVVRDLGSAAGLWPIELPLSRPWRRL